MDLIN